MNSKEKKRLTNIFINIYIDYLVLNCDYDEIKYKFYIDELLNDINNIIDKNVNSNSSFIKELKIFKMIDKNKHFIEFWYFQIKNILGYLIDKYFDIDFNNQVNATYYDIDNDNGNNGYFELWKDKQFLYDDCDIEKRGIYSITLEGVIESVVNYDNYKISKIDFDFKKKNGDWFL